VKSALLQTVALLIDNNYTHRANAVSSRTHFLIASGCIFDRLHTE
jgi:hypothetical protein